MEEPRHDLDDVRSELRRLGYLSDRFDRFLLQDALRQRASAWALLAAAGRVAVLGGVLVAAVSALGLAWANGSLGRTPFDLLVLFLHLLVPAALGAGAAFLLLSVLLLGVLALFPVRRIEALSLSVAVAAGGGLVVWLVPRVVELGESDGLGMAALAALAGTAAAAAAVKVVHAGLLALAVRWTHVLPERRALSRPFHFAAVLLVASLLVLPPLLAIRRGSPAPPPSIPSAPAEQVLLVGLDGVLAEELEYLLAAGALPTLAGLLEDGGVLAAYRRPAGPPATFWASVGTGRPAPEHGVAAVDSFRPLGVGTPLARSGWLRPWWSGVAVPLGLAEYRPILANRRTAFTVWELAAHGGAPVVAANWWATFPAEPLPGLVVAHGAFQLLPDDPAAAVAPDRWVAEMAALRQAAATAALRQAPRGLPEEAARFLATAVTGPDRFYRQALLAGLQPHTRAAALYLAGPDIAADGWRWTDLAFADLLRSELAATDRTLAAALAVQRPGTVAVVVDPGRRGVAAALRGGDRRGIAEGRVILWRQSGCAALPATGSGRSAERATDGLSEGRGDRAEGGAAESTAAATASRPASDASGGRSSSHRPAPASTSLAAEPGPSSLRIEPRSVASGLLRALGLPQSDDLPAPPGACVWGPPHGRLPSFGARREPGPPPRDAEEYLESLRALGYL